MAPRLLVIRQPAFWHLDAARGPSTPSFDHLVGAAEQRDREIDPERFGDNQVDDQLDLHRLLNRQIRWLLAPENTAHVNACLTGWLYVARAIAHQPAGIRELARRIDRRHPMTCRQDGQLLSPVREKRISFDDNRLHPPLHQCREGSIDLAWIAGAHNMELEPELERR